MEVEGGGATATMYRSSGVVSSVWSGGVLEPSLHPPDIIHAMNAPTFFAALPILCIIFNETHWEQG